LPRADAEAIDRAVQAWAGSGAGTVIRVDDEFRLFVAGYVVAFLLDGPTMHVDAIRRP
jgi:hypothetical protein